MRIVTFISLIILLSMVNILADSVDVNIINPGYLPVSRSEFISIANEIYQYECSRLNYRESFQLTVEINSLENDIRGMVIPIMVRSIIYLEKDSIKTIPKLKGIFAHELGHILYYKWLKPNFGTGNLYWDEGFASWIAGKYYLEWQGYNDYKSALKNIDFYEPTTQLINMRNDSNQPAKIRDIVYMKWSSFIDYLITKFGFTIVKNLCNVFISDLDKNDHKYEIKSYKKMTREESFERLKEVLKLKEMNEPKETIEILKNAYYKLLNISFEDLVDQWELANSI